MAIIPYLYYQDVRAALKFLSRAFGLRNYGRPMVRSDGKVNHAAMKLGDGLVMMGYPGSTYRNPKRLGQATQSLLVNVPNVDQHFQRARKAGATIIEEPKDTFFGHRRYAAEDPEGHHWYFDQETKKPAGKRTARRPRRI